MSNKAKSISLAIALLLACMAFATSCANGEYRSDKSGYKERIITSVVEASNEDDAQAIVALFSDDVAARNASLAAEAEEFVKAVDGEYVSSKVKYQTEDKTKNEERAYKTQIVCEYVVETTAGKYVIVFADYPEVNSDEYKGVQSLGVQSYGDFENEKCFAASYDGIYVVTPDNHDEIESLR